MWLGVGFLRGCVKACLFLAMSSVAWHVHYVCLNAYCGLLSVRKVIHQVNVAWSWLFEKLCEGTYFCCHQEYRMACTSLFFECTLQLLVSLKSPTPGQCGLEC